MIARAALAVTRPEELRSVGYDEPATLTQFANVLAHARGPVLLHCTAGWRASHLSGRRI